MEKNGKEKKRLWFAQLSNVESHDFSFLIQCYFVSVVFNKFYTGTDNYKQIFVTHIEFKIISFSFCSYNNLRVSINLFQS